MSSSSNTPRHFLDLTELPTSELRNMLAAAVAMKAKRKATAVADKPLAGKTLAMIFDKPSTRTRVSFDVGMRQLGGESIMLTGTEMQLGRGETVPTRWFGPWRRGNARRRQKALSKNLIRGCRHRCGRGPGVGNTTCREKSGADRGQLTLGPD